MTLSPQLKSALARAIAGAALAFAATFLASLQTGQDLRISAIAGGAAAVAYLAARGGVEGAYDHQRALSGNLKPSDVQASGSRGTAGL